MKRQISYFSMIRPSPQFLPFFFQKKNPSVTEKHKKIENFSHIFSTTKLFLPLKAGMTKNRKGNHRTKKQTKDERERSRSIPTTKESVF